MSSNPPNNIFGNRSNTEGSTQPQKSDAPQPQSAESGQAPGNADSATLAETAPQGNNPPVGKHDGSDENNPINQAAVESLQEGAALQSAGAQALSGNPPQGEAAPASESGDKPVLAEYTSGSIRNFRVGRFQFENGRLQLTEQADVDRFEKLYEAMTPRDKAIVTRLGDAKANADAIARRFLADSTMRRGVDTSEPKPGEPR